MFWSTKNRERDNADPRGGGENIRRDLKKPRDASNGRHDPKIAQAPIGRDRHRDRDNGPNRDRGGSQPQAVRRRISGSQAVQSAKIHLEELTGRPAELVSALNRTREGWRVVLEVVEMERVPRTTDILASYVVDLDETGGLMGYERVGRYYRNDVGGDQ